MAVPIKILGAYTLINDTVGESETAYSVDKISTDIINDNDLCITEHGNGIYFYNAKTYEYEITVNDDLPYYIKPNDEIGYQRWSLMDIYGRSIVTDSLSANNGELITVYDDINVLNNLYSNYTATNSLSAVSGIIDDLTVNSTLIVAGDLTVHENATIVKTLTVDTVYSTNSMYVGGNAVLTTINEGHGSGIDSDTVDTKHYTDIIARENHTGTQPQTTITGHDKTTHDALNINADTVDGQHFAWSNTSNTPTYLWAANTTGSAFLASRASISVNYATSCGNADTVDGYHASALVSFLAGTRMVFYQAYAPTGWTQYTAHNDKALRVVSGVGGGAAGSHGLSAPPSIAHTHSVGGHAHTTTGHVLTINELPSHKHIVPYAESGTGYWGNSSSPQNAPGSGRSDSDNNWWFTSPVGAGASHTHGNTGTATATTATAYPTAFAPKYIDVIVCTKN